MSCHHETAGDPQRIFSREQSRKANSYAPDTTSQVTTEDEEDAVDRLSQNEKSLYPARVNNMRMQFAWAAVILAFSWIFVIIFIILSHGIGFFHIHPFLQVAWGIGGTLTIAIVAYCSCMIGHVFMHHSVASTADGRRWSLFWRQAASPISFLTASLGGVCIFILSPRWIDNYTQYGFKGLSDSVLITLITSTTVSVLGILGAVMWWLFPRKETHH